MRKQLKIESKIINLRIVESVIDAVTSEIGINKENYGKILISTLEAVNNAIVHGNKSDPLKNVEILFSFHNEVLKVKIKDEGTGFKPETVPDPTVPENIEALSGRGIFLMSRLSDGIEFNEKGNCVTMIFKNISY